MSDLSRTVRMAMAAAALLCGAIASAAPARVDQLVRTALELEPNGSHGAYSESLVLPAVRRASL